MSVKVNFSQTARPPVKKTQISLHYDIVSPAPGPIDQSILSLTSLLRGQLVKCFMTFLPNTLSHSYLPTVIMAICKILKLI